MKKTLSIVLVLLVISAFSLPPVTLSATASGDYQYTVVDGYAKITGYTGTDSNLTVPGEINGYTVNAIANYVFTDNEYLQTVILADSIEVLGRAAFSDCTNLKEVTLSKNLVNIQDLTFYNCSSLDKINFNSNLKTIGSFSFSGCSSLKYINLPAEFTTFGAYAFGGCTGLAYIRIPHSVTAMYESAFEGTDKSLLTIVGCSGSYAETYASDYGFLFATIPCRNHLFIYTYGMKKCTCCGALVGDVDGDGSVTPADAILFSRYLNDPSLPYPDFEILDIIPDGVLDANDETALRKLIAGNNPWA